MADEEQVYRLKQRVAWWNEWRKKNPGREIDLSGANLEKANLFGADLKGASLFGVNFFGANLREVGL